MFAHGQSAVIPLRIPFTPTSFFILFLFYFYFLLWTHFIKLDTVVNTTLIQHDVA